MKFSMGKRSILGFVAGAIMTFGVGSASIRCSHTSYGHRDRHRLECRDLSLHD